MDKGKDIVMTIKVIGVIFVLISCGSVGFKIAANYKKEEKHLQNLTYILDYMIAELQYKLTPLPQLCRQVAQLFSGFPGNIFGKLSEELELYQQTDTAQCITAVLDNTKNITPITREQIMHLGNTLGRFDLEGQITGINTLRLECERYLQSIRDNRDNRMRSYQTLGLCAGAALAILFV